MNLSINGLQHQVEAGLTISRLLELEREPAHHVLVEVNGAYVPADEYDRRVLEEGDRVEIIYPAYGG